MEEAYRHLIGEEMKGASRKLPVFDPQDAYIQTGYDFTFESEVCLPCEVRCHRDNEGNLEIIGLKVKGFDALTSAKIHQGMPYREDVNLAEEMRVEAELIEKE